jgi:hypothetical protein
MLVCLCFYFLIFAFVFIVISVSPLFFFGYPETRDQSSGPFVTKEDGGNMAKTICAVRYMECSGKNNIGVKEVFDRAIRCGVCLHGRRC